MMDGPRYAIYFAPAPDTAFWSFGSRVLGYDAATGLDVPGFTLPGTTEERWRSIVARPRTYGFHAALKAPFHLNDADEGDLMSALDAFARGRPPIDLGRLKISAFASGASGAGFAAFTPVSPASGLRDLERDIVTGLDRFRRSTTPAERDGRRPDSLTERQRAHLDAYGYPFVLDDFRFHMTLTGEIANIESISAQLADAADRALAELTVSIDAICLFRQDRRSSSFRIIGRHNFEL
jgi:2'-5' RNA ligase